MEGTDAPAAIYQVYFDSDDSAGLIRVDLPRFEPSPSCGISEQQVEYQVAPGSEQVWLSLIGKERVATIDASKARSFAGQIVPVTITASLQGLAEDVEFEVLFHEVGEEEEQPEDDDSDDPPVFQANTEPDPGSPASQFEYLFSQKAKDEEPYQDLTISKVSNTGYFSINTSQQIKHADELKALFEE